VAIIALLLYFGWPVIEAIIIMLPLPDPKVVKEKIVNMVSKSASTISSLKNGTASTVKKPGYTSSFKDAPETLGESDDEDDIGNKANIKKGSGLNYDSDDTKEDSELISLDNTNERDRDRTGTAAENIPKLQKPL